MEKREENSETTGIEGEMLYYRDNANDKEGNEMQKNERLI